VVIFNRVGIRDLEILISSYVDRVSCGEQIVLTDHGEEPREAS
jgi:antitoxin (DNA-binding transcriptional repressor) of toxin-antitoxin stability system